MELGIVNFVIIKIFFRKIIKNINNKNFIIIKQKYKIK
jgi:hypothetical protein